jgi:hypothetical protein
MDMTELYRSSGRAGTRSLSEALRLGAYLRPQIRGGLFRDGGSCALGAIYEATFYNTDHNYFEMLEALLQAYPELENEWCDIESRSVRVLIREIYKRNDSGRTREQLADWLAQLGY